MSLALVPALKEMKDPPLMASLIQSVGRRYRRLGWTCLFVLLITGYINLTARGFSHASLRTREFWTSPFGETLSWKLWLFALLILLSLAHDVSSGPRLQSMRKTHPEKAERYRKAATWMGRTTLIISLIITLLAVIMVRGRPW
jgi:putative copper export protein